MQQQGVAKRAPSSEESRMFCGFSNPTMFINDKFESEMLLGPWFETMYSVLLNDKEKVKSVMENQILAKTALVEKIFSKQENMQLKLEEFQKTFLAGGPGSEEPVLCIVELNVLNVIEMTCCINKKITFLSTFALNKERFSKWDQVVLSIEGARFVGNKFEGARLVLEKPEFICGIQEEVKQQWAKKFGAEDVEGEYQIKSHCKK